MGWGGYLYSDKTGPTSKIGLYLAYGYHIVIQKDLQLSFGLNAGLMQYKIDMNKIVFEQEEQDLKKNKYSYLKPDGAVGTYLYATRYYVGLSVDQLFNNKIIVSRNDTAIAKNSYNRLKSHYTVIGGYKFNLNRDFDMEPSLLFRATTKTMPQAEVTVKAIYQKIAWLGVSFRSSDAITLLGGYNYKDQLFIGYSYDITYSRIRLASAGSHEIMIGARFNKIRSGARPKM